MEGYLLVIGIFVFIFLYNFILSFFKILIFKFSTGAKGSSFKMTIAYMLGKSELQDLIKGTKNV